MLDKNNQTKPTPHPFKTICRLFPGLIRNSRIRTIWFGFLNMCPGLLGLWPAWKDWKQLALHELINFAWNVTEFPLINTWKYALRISSISDSILVFSTILTEIRLRSFDLVFSLFQPLLYCSNLAVYVVQFRRTGFTFSIRYSSDSWNTCDL